MASVDPAVVNSTNIVTIGGFAAFVVSALVAFIYWVTKQHDKREREYRQEMAGLVKVSSDAAIKQAETNEALKVSVDRLADKSKTEQDYASLMLKVLQDLNTSNKKNNE